MRVKRINFQTLNLMAHDDVISIIGERRFRADVNHGAVRAGHDRIGRFAALVALKAADVEALMHLPAVAADTAETAACPGFAHRADEEFFLATRFKQRAVRGRKLEGLSEACCHGSEKNCPRKRAEALAQDGNYHLLFS